MQDGSERGSAFFYEALALLQALQAQCRYAKFREPRNQNQRRAVGCLEDTRSGFEEADLPDAGDRGR